ncbi:MAG: hypothetical protein J0L96_06775 [Anaerolineae bacterium]|nr:hypothetical protein [Anaerolineae bacterium]
MNNRKENSGAEHQLTYRQEILSRFFGFVQNTDSFYMVGAASMGKTRLLDFLMRADIQDHYLKAQSKKTWLVRVDLNRMPVVDNWGFYFFELLLSSIILCCISRKDIDQDILKELVDIDSELIKSRDVLFALRYFEWGVGKICQKYDVKICFLFDEFDEAYRKMPHEIFAQLRAIRDANKNFLIYALLLRNPPKKIRAGNDNESFYELLSRNAIGIGPYSMTDTLNIIQNLEEDWGMQLTPTIKEKLGQVSGGHPGIIKALMSLVKDPAIASRLENNTDWIPWFCKQETILEECRKIWLGLDQDERLTLLAPFRGEKSIDTSAFNLLALKGILKGNGMFSPFFEYYLKSGLAKTDDA